MSNGTNVGEFFFGTIRALKRKSNEQEALKILHQMASQVKPIMRKRGWRVGTLREFFPKNPNLLGLNKNYGQEICIRLRPSSNDSRFLPYEALLGTLLHELTHIVRGPHDQQFYKLLDELTAECEALMVKGFTGEGFYGAGHRVGQGISHNLPPHIARTAAVEAAEKRRQIGEIMGPVGGRKLGGKSLTKNLEKLYTPRMLAAMAAERRARDNVWCAGNVENADIYDEPKARTHIDLLDDIEPPQKSQPEMETQLDNPSKITNSTLTGPLTKPESKRLHRTNEQEPIPRKRPREMNDDMSSWVCQICTLVNPPLVLVCECCLTERPPNQSLATSSKEPKILSEWSCPQCTLFNSPSTSKCQICDFVIEA